ncbi:MAG: YHYH domain-containing protein [Rhodospirillaceae bacterium]|nr:YHYH domain-containing protein [Rhodospirillaceae bacterium]
MRSSCRFIPAALFAAAALAASIGLATVTPAAAHPGSLAKDGCHRDKAAGDRHWHKDGTRQRAGVCIDRNGKTVKQPVLITIPEADYRRMEADLRTAAAGARHWRAAHDEQAAARKAAEHRAAADRSAAAAARVIAENARQDMLAAERRARGKGPAVSPRCRRGVHAALDSGWRFSAEEKEALRRACLYEESG